MSEWLGCKVADLTIMLDHIHMVVSVQPKVSMSEYMGVPKRKTAIKLFKNNPGMRVKPYWGNHFWARGYFVSTVGIDEETIRKYVKYQEQEEKREEKQQGNFRFL